MKNCKVCKKEITDDTAHQLNGNCAKCFLVYLNSNYIIQPKVPVVFFTIGIIMLGIIGIMVFLLLAVGAVFQGSILFSCKDGPYEVFKKMRIKYGKPLTCAFCMTNYMGVIIPIMHYSPPVVSFMVGTPGLVQIILHFGNIHPLYEPNPGE